MTTISLLSDSNLVKLTTIASKAYNTRLMKLNFDFPLPKENLHKRYDPVFTALKKGLCATLIGFPKSARSGYLKFLLEYDKKVLSEFIDPDIYKFIFIDEAEVSINLLVRVVASKLLFSDFLPQNSHKKLEDILKFGDQILLSSALIELIKKSQKKKLVLILYNTEKIIEKDPDAGSFLARVWNTKRNQPNSLVHIIFIGSPSLLVSKNTSLYKEIRVALEESISYFPLFNESEMIYLRKRLEFFSGIKITNEKDALIRKLADGHTVLYRILSNLTDSEIKKLSAAKTHPSIDILINEIWQGLPLSLRKKWNTKKLSQNTLLINLDLLKKGLPRITLLPPLNEDRHEEINGIKLPDLTAQQRILMDFFTKVEGAIISRDEVAQNIWGKLWGEKYSDWAIDQAIFKLRKKLVMSPFEILAHRNRGYQLVKK